MTTYTAHCEWDPTGWWAVTVPSVPGAITQSRRLDQVPGAIAEAIELMTGETPDDYRLKIDWSVPGAAGKAAGHAHRLRQEADDLAPRAGTATGRRSAPCVTPASPTGTSAGWSVSRTSASGSWSTRSGGSARTSASMTAGYANDSQRRSCSGKVTGAKRAALHTSLAASRLATRNDRPLSSGASPPTARRGLAPAPPRLGLDGQPSASASSSGRSGWRRKPSANARKIRSRLAPPTGASGTARTTCDRLA